MPKTVNPIKKDIVKQSIKAGKSFKQSLLDAGYTQATAGHTVNPKNTLLNMVKEEIRQEMKASDITVDLVILQLTQDRNLAYSKGDIATMTRVDELLGKFLAMFTDKAQVKTEDITQHDKDILDKYIQTNRLNVN